MSVASATNIARAISIEKTYGKKGAELVRMNFEAVDQTLANLHEVKVPAAATSKLKMPPIVPVEAPDFVQKITAIMLANKGDLLPVSAFPVDGTFATATAQWEKRNIAIEIPTWDEKLCIQCNKCVMVCPHAAIRAKVYRARPAREGPGHLQVGRLPGPRVQGDEVHDPGRPGRLHGLQPLRGRLPRQGQGEPAAQVPRHGPRRRRCARPSARTSSSSSTFPSPTGRS